MIEIHLDGKPVTKLVAARALSVAGARLRVQIGFPGEDGTLGDCIDLYARQYAYGEVEPPLASSPSFGADAARMRRRARVLLAAAEVAELAEMIAAEQDAKQEQLTQAIALATALDARGAAQRARARAAKSGFKPVAEA